MNAISYFRESVSLSRISVKTLVLFFVILILACSSLKGQVLKDTATLRQVKETVDLIYNMRFEEAQDKCNEIEKNYPGHPVDYLLRGLIIYWKNYPLLAGSGPGIEFEKQMHLCISACEDFEPENEAEFLLANMCARGSMLAYFVGNELQSKVFSLGRTTYRYFRRSFKFTGTFPDFFFFTGLYNYYREAYPEAHPAYKPLFAIFPAGDMQKGLDELQVAFRDAIFIRAEAATFLSSIYKFFENDYASASHFSTAINNEYPENMVYRLNHIEDLLLNDRFDEAEKLIEIPDSEGTNLYFKAQLSIFRAILDEKKYNDMKKAEQEYLTGIENISGYRAYGKQHKAYALFGLSRISSFNNDRHSEKVFRRNANELTDFENVNFDD